MKDLLEKRLDENKYEMWEILQQIKRKSNVYCIPEAYHPLLARIEKLLQKINLTA